MEFPFGHASQEKFYWSAQLSTCVTSKKPERLQDGDAAG